MSELEKEFVPYQESLELKELGFDEPCFGKYLSSLQSDWKEFELILKRGMNEEFENNRNIYLLEGACSAPTFSQAFRWFREKGFVVDIYSENNIDWFFLIKKDVITTNNDIYKNEEEAELACLRKLIQIVKNKI